MGAINSTRPHEICSVTFLISSFAAVSVIVSFSVRPVVCPVVIGTLNSIGTVSMVKPSCRPRRAFIWINKRKTPGFSVGRSIQTQVPKTDWDISSCDLDWKVAIQDRPVIVTETPNFTFRHEIESARFLVFLSPSRPAEIHRDRPGSDILILIPIENSACATLAQGRFGLGNNAFFDLCLYGRYEADAENRDRKYAFHFLTPFLGLWIPFGTRSRSAFSDLWACSLCFRRSFCLRTCVSPDFIEKVQEEDHIVLRSLFFSSFSGHDGSD